MTVQRRPGCTFCWARRDQRLIRRTRTGPDTFTQDELEWVVFVPLIGEQGWPERVRRGEAGRKGQG
ncbi:MAG: hypothetical protein HYR50_04070 [Candidatus Rokubacteria bacterium]|nr:hypothetical protein [Candidatus Rokubacteria bacterium]